MACLVIPLHDPSRHTVVQPAQSYHPVPCPVPLKSLSEPPDVRVDKYINRIRSWAATYIPTPSHSMWTTINTYLPNMDTDTWLPPYTGTVAAGLACVISFIQDFLLQVDQIHSFTQEILLFEKHFN